MIKQGPCSKCGSSDACTLYDNGTTYCFSCHKSGGKRTHQPEQLSQRDWSGTMHEISQLSSANLLARGISAKVAGLYGVKVEYDGSRQEQNYYFPLYNTDEKHVGYEKRRAKGPGLRQKGDVCRIGDTGGCLPFGATLVGSRGKMLIVTEGAADALAAFEMITQHQPKGYRVVASMGTDQWRSQLAYYEGFDKVVIAFDMDEGGQAAAQDLSAALTYGKAYIMRWDAGKGNDPNELLINGEHRRFYDAVFAAKPYEPTGIISGDQVWQRMQDYVQPASIPYPPEWSILGAKMQGLREGEISMWTAGSSIGKTSYIRRLKQHALQVSDWNIGEVELEESPEKTWRGLMQFHAGSKWHHMTDEERHTAFLETYGTNRIYTLDNGLDSKKRSGGLLGKFKALHYDKGCRLFFLDHVTLGVREFGDGGSSLGDQDTMMEEFLGFVEQTKSHLVLISHLRKPAGGSKSWSQGAVPDEESMKGSGSLYQISFDIIGVSRNKQHPDDYERNVSQLHVLKCRETGDTGPADRLFWDNNLNRLEPAMDASPTEQED